MTKAEAIKMFGGRSKLAKALGITFQAVAQWSEGNISEPRHSHVLVMAARLGLIAPIGRRQQKRKS
ncbi:MAG: Cro/CI family transcriptional regulator [Nitrososphaera sp.]